MSNTSLLGSFGGQAGDALMFRNVLINGNFDVWQRGTTGTAVNSSNLRVADRWTTTIAGTNINYTCAQSSDVPNLASVYSMSWTQTTGQNATSVLDYALRQVIEKQNTLGLVGKPVTVSFWYKSNVTGTHGVRVIGSASGYTGGTDQSLPFTVNTANTWEYKTLTFTAVQGVTAVTGDMSGIGMYLDIGPRVNQVGQTSFAGDSYFRVAQAQLEAGPTATPFERRPIGTELALCQRYYERIDSNYLFQSLWAISRSNGTRVDTKIFFPVAKRIDATVTISSFTIVSNYSPTGDQITLYFPGATGLFTVSSTGWSFVASATKVSGHFRLVNANSSAISEPTLQLLQVATGPNFFAEINAEL